MLRDLIPTNQLLAALPETTYQRLRPHLEEVHLEPKQVLFEPGDRPSHVFFPKGAMISMVAVVEDGSTVEIAVVGREGVTGVPALLGDKVVSHRAIVQIEGAADQISTDAFLTEFERSKSSHQLILRYTQALFAQVAQGAVCNRLHTIDERLARWLLTVQDGILANNFQLTQEFIAEMIGTRRSSVTVAAKALQQAGAIRYSRGRITISDRSCLEGLSCECYKVIKNEFVRLLEDEQS